MKTFDEILKKYEFTDFEDDEGPIVSSMFHKDDIVKAVKEWLEEQKVTTGADDSPRIYDMWIDKLIQSLCVNPIKEGKHP